MIERILRNALLDQMDEVLQKIREHDAKYQPSGSEPHRKLGLDRLAKRIGDTRI